MAEERDIKIVSMDGEPFDVPLKVAKMSGLVSSILNDPGKEVITIDVTSDALRHVLKYCINYMEEPMTEFEKVQRRCEFDSRVFIGYI